MPDAGGWTGLLNYYGSAGCTVDTVRAQVRAFYTSPEFMSRPYDSAARVLALYRGPLNREPDQGGLDTWTAQLNNGALTWPQVVESIVTSAELTNLVPVICTSSPLSTSYYYGTQPAPTLPVSGGGFGGGTGQQLQAALNATPPGGRVVLAQKAVVRLIQTLVIPPGVTLTTNGAPGPTAYATQGRLVRSSLFAGPMVDMESGGRLDSVWVDGQRGIFTNYQYEALDVRTLGGSGTTVTNSKLSNSAGWSTLQALGSFEDHPCASVAVTGNLITAYSSDHHYKEGIRGRWTDGLSIACENARIESNAVIDATDVGIVMFRSTPANQASVVRNNQVLSAGNSGYGALGVDAGVDRGVTPTFNGATVSGNAFWTAPRTHFDIGLAVGVRPWFALRADPGTGVTVSGNTTNGLLASVRTGIAVSGMFNATVQANNLQVALTAEGRCPLVNFGIDADGFASGSFQPGAQQVHFVNPNGDPCIGHP